MKPIRFSLWFEPSYMWVGVSWKAIWMWDYINYEKPKKVYMISLRIFITVIPTLPLSIVIDIQRVKSLLINLKKESDQRIDNKIV